MDLRDLHAYVDNELSAEQAESVRSNLESSPGDRREVEAIQSLKSMLASKTVAPAVGDSWMLAVKRLDEIDKSKRVERVVSRFAPALCAGLFVFIVVTGQIVRHSSHNRTGSPDLMVGASIPLRSPSASSTDKKRWLDALLKQSKLSPDILTFVGALSCEINGYPATSFQARDASGDLNVIVIPQLLSFEGMPSMDGRPDLRVGHMNGSNCVLRAQGDATIIIVADRPYAELAMVADEVKVP